MTLERAKAVLADDVQDDGSLHNGSRYLNWEVGDSTACLDAHFTADELEAIVVWMRAGRDA